MIRRPASASNAVIASASVVVYGLTWAGVQAVESARLLGMTAIIVGESEYAGGIVGQGGLTATDLWYKTSCGGRTWQDLQRLGAMRGDPLPVSFLAATTSNDDNSPGAASEARRRFWASDHEALMEEKLRACGATVIRSAPILETGGVVMNGKTIAAIVTTKGRIEGKAFVDATYAGDLMKQAGVTYTVGREPASQYGEVYAGVIERHTVDMTGIAIRDGNGQPLFPLIENPNQNLGDGDTAINAMNFRCQIVLRSAEPSIPFWKPRNYDKSQFALIKAYWAAKNITNFKSSAVVLYDLMNSSFAFGTRFNSNNGYGPFHPDLPHYPWPWPTGTRATKAQIQDLVKGWVAGIFWTAAFDPEVSPALRASAQLYGYAADQFVGNRGFPREMYVREGLRMVGQYVLTESDITGNASKTDTICKGVYIIDCHNQKTYISGANEITEEGGLYITNSGVYRIPQRMIVPKVGECENLVVPICCSVSHVAWQPTRMELAFAMMGEAAGVMAAQNAFTGTRMQSLDYLTQIKPALLARGAVI